MKKELRINEVKVNQIIRKENLKELKRLLRDSMNSRYSIYINNYGEARTHHDWSNDPDEHEIKITMFAKKGIPHMEECNSQQERRLLITDKINELAESIIHFYENWNGESNVNLDKWSSHYEFWKF